MERKAVVKIHIIYWQVFLFQFVSYGCYNFNIEVIYNIAEDEGTHPSSEKLSRNWNLSSQDSWKL